MFSLVLPHVDGGEGNPGGVESGLDNGVGVSHEGEYSSVGGVARVNIQKTGTGSGSNSICYGLYDLIESRFMQGLGVRCEVSICQTFESLPSEKFGTHSIILDISPACGVATTSETPQCRGPGVSFWNLFLKRVSHGI